MLGNLDSNSRITFWKHLATCKPWKCHPALHRNDVSYDKLVGFTIHADGAQMYSDDEFFVYSISSVFSSEGCTKDILLVKIPLAIIPERQMRSKDVRAAVNKVVADVTAWSLKICTSGVGPQRGFYNEAFPEKSYRHGLSGKILAGGWKGCYVAFKADLKARVQVHALTRNYLCNLICDRCLAATGDKCPESMYYKNFSHTAAWPLTAIDHEMHMQMDTPSPWSVVEGFNFESLSYDWLHNVYLGIGRDLVASGILVLIEHNVFPLGADLDETLGNVHREVRRTCAKNGLYFPCKPQLTKANVGGSDDFAVLGSRFKGATVKTLIWWLAVTSQKVSDQRPTEPILALLATCCFWMQRSIHIQDRSGLTFSRITMLVKLGSLSSSTSGRMWIWLPATFPTTACCSRFAIRPIT
ncbi:unnamed protein product [Cladocopium goreaui]|uniref:Uncharacterized protein n=1 Tax=Cladocopium goreaui TaxID=2562237 RepID=A0A9P1BSK6_9DINO|nr:unnamed protein product [Cladocopium goreaui]